jgi:hypothetical protein
VARRCRTIAEISCLPSGVSGPHTQLGSRRTSLVRIVSWQRLRVALCSQRGDWFARFWPRRRYGQDRSDDHSTQRGLSRSERPHWTRGTLTEWLTKTGSCCRQRATVTAQAFRTNNHAVDEAVLRRAPGPGMNQAASPFDKMAGEAPGGVRDDARPAADERRTRNRGAAASGWHVRRHPPRSPAAVGRQAESG